MTGRFFAFSILAFVALVFSGCSQRGEDLAKQYGESWNKILEESKTIKDATSFDKALPNIQKAVDSIVSIDKQLKDLQITTEEAAVLNKQLTDPELQLKVNTEMSRIQILSANNPDLKPKSDKLIEIFHNAYRYNDPPVKSESVSK